MILTPFEIDLYRHLSPFFTAQGFTLMAEKKQYRKTTATGFQNVILSPAFYGDETWLEVNLGTRNEQIEQIGQQFLNNLPDFRPDANTLILSIGKLQGLPYFRYKIASDAQLADTCRTIEAFMTESGFSFLQSAESLSGIDTLLNESPGQPSRYVYNQTHRCYKAIIAARLTNNPHFDGLIDRYRHQLNVQTRNPYEQLNFERLVAFLLHYSMN
ncbi:hypothetical protein [Rudanella lutea]|uniref:hypothetical protein n=1 Tax=Rudanella lutea TaxID=451374 RepID=UPI0003759FAE|nr:hypothetical protein [Rudanella lutea]